MARPRQGLAARLDRAGEARVVLAPAPEALAGSAARVAQRARAASVERREHLGDLAHPGSWTAAEPSVT